MSKKKKPCPVCHKTDQLIPIVYGLPLEELFKDAEKGKFLLGGCVIENDSPFWYCKRDNVSF